MLDKEGIVQYERHCNEKEDFVKEDKLLPLENSSVCVCVCATWECVFIRQIT